ncbi:hypothetical protein [Pedobacter sp. ASV28]|uniref:hypothetical protein n=1 Tax=Pedobacter sp. ASV28 TaxID=2795123 RepID=UPI0018EA9CD9|nr:hypothetical protein [Pedobacter sp. ASV28]
MTLKEQIAWCKIQIKAGNEVVPIRSILARLQQLEKCKEPASSIYNQYISEYGEFLNRRNVPLVMDGRQGKALKNIIAKLSQASTDKSDNGIFTSWKFILRNWNRTGDFIGRQIKLSDIDRNLQEIFDKIRNGATKKQHNLNEAERFHQQLTK